jgi:hypothetical protein
MPKAYAYSLIYEIENNEYNVPLTNVRTYILSCSNRSFNTFNTSFLNSTHFYFP